MKNIYDINGLIFWNHTDIKLRNYLKEHFAASVQEILEKENSAWKSIEIEAPLLTPRNLLNSNYTNEDIWVQENSEHELALRPETTPGSYAYAQYLLETNQAKPPLIVWQAGKSFRREQDQVSKNMRLKEFYQQEFQCIYTTDTLNDYHSAVLEPMAKLLGDACNLKARIVESDRLPSYSQITMDIEVKNDNKWMEVCSISRRTDFPCKVSFQTKKSTVEKELLVLEIAIGLDRVIYNRNHIDRTKIKAE